MAWIALGGYLIYLALAFGLRTWLQIRATGSSGFKGINGRPTYSADRRRRSTAACSSCAPIAVGTRSRAS